MASGSIVINHSPRVVISVQLEISFIETLIVLWWQRTCCSSDCGSRVVRKASEGNLETPTDLVAAVGSLRRRRLTRDPTN